MEVSRFGSPSVLKSLSSSSLYFLSPDSKVLSRTIPWAQAFIQPVFHPSSFPALETFTIYYNFWVSNLLSASLSNPSSLPSLKTLTFLYYDLLEYRGFMEALTQFASNRKNTTSTWLHRVLIIDCLSRKLPSPYSIEALRRHFPVVDASMTTDLVWRGSGRRTSLAGEFSERGRVCTP